MKTIREVKCDHAIENPKLHPVSQYINVGNLIIAMCGTCYNAVKGQIYDMEIPGLKKPLESEEAEDE